MLFILALLPILSVAARTGLLQRQDDAADCAAPCQALSDAVSANAGTSANLCTSTIVGDYAACYNCEVKNNGLAQSDAQQIIDSYVAGCKAEGHAVDGVSIGGAAPGAPTTSGGAPTTSGSASPPPAGKTGGAAHTSTGLVGVTSAFIAVYFAAL
ncbi:hypothetical protein B0H17DRAFT_1140048 [Mycena rosella]|uniref:Uncharacterized protein n=1 Tax=Mycena rosella TaxID=1033263 RepID=A0AAD7D6J7_MYCRO|nr:hypothetical protein B0H17DRAFT_1140048 [Mycena rosella]